MCEKCVEIDKNLERYQRLASAIADQKAVDALSAKIAELRAEKAALHPEPETTRSDPGPPT
jgi:hypothetical protein